LDPDSSPGGGFRSKLKGQPYSGPYILTAEKKSPSWKPLFIIFSRNWVVYTQKLQMLTEIPIDIPHIVWEWFKYAAW
jgi:hypothetical protein